jgi:hypothetical protein
MTTNEYGEWTPWGPQRDLYTRINEWPKGEWDHDKIRHGGRYRARQVFEMPEVLSPPEPVQPEPLTLTNRPQLVLSDGRVVPFLTTYCDLPVPPELQKEMWEMQLLRKNIDYDWETDWICFVTQIHHGDIPGAVEDCRENWKPNGGAWKRVVSYVMNQAEGHRKRHGAA